MTAGIRLKDVCMRDFHMEPLKGKVKGFEFRQFVASVHLLLELTGPEWQDVQEADFTIRAKERELEVKCKGPRNKSGILDDLNCKFKKVDIIPRESCYRLAANGKGNGKVLVIELAKKVPGAEWSEANFFHEMFRRQHFGWRPEMKGPEQDPAWVTLPTLRRRDAQDPFITRRATLVGDLAQGQTEEVMQFRLYLYMSRLEDAMRRVAPSKLFGLDVAEDRMRLFVRGDAHSIVLEGRFGGSVVPEESWLALGEEEKECEGPDGPVKEMCPYLDVLLAKAPNSKTEWEDMLLPLDDGATNGAGGPTALGAEAAVEELEAGLIVKPRIFRLRDFPMEPYRGVEGPVQWLHFAGSVQLWLPLDGQDWEDVTEKDFEVKVAEKALCVNCKDRSLVALTSQLHKEVNTSACFYSLERDLAGPDGERKVLVIELTKKTPGRVWSDGVLMQSVYTPDPNDNSWIMLKPGRRRDVDDPFITSRGWMCLECEQGQTHDLVQWRLVLEQKKLDMAVMKVPYYKVFGMDVSEKYFKLFIRGDETSPVMIGELGGNVVPMLTTCELTRVTREVQGHRVPGTTETVPVLDVTLHKASGSTGEWEDLLLCDDDEGPDGPAVVDLEDYAEKKLKGREASPDRGEWTPDDFADEQKERADEAFKDGNYRDAIVFYTRALRYTPKNERLLSNRSACYIRIQKYQMALEDANKAEAIEPSWPKVYFRKGQALRGLRQFQEAIAAFEKGKEVDPENPEWDREVQRTTEVETAFSKR